MTLRVGFSTQRDSGRRPTRRRHKAGTNVTRRKLQRDRGLVPTPTEQTRRRTGIRQPKAWAVGALALITSGTAIAEFGSFGGSATRVATPIDTTRVYETRVGEAYTTVDGHYAGMGRLWRGATAEFHVPGRGAVSPTASEVDLEIRVIKPGRRGTLTVHACDAPRGDNTMAFSSRWTRSVVRTDVAADGTVCIHTDRSTDLVVDVIAQVTSDAAQPEPTIDEAQITPVERVRLLETRLGKRRYTVDGHYNRFGRIGPDRSTDVYVAGRGAIPADAVGVELKVVTRGARSPGVLTIDACGSGAEQVKFADGVKGRATVVVPLDEFGRICVASTATTHVTLDGFGYIAAGDEQPSTTAEPATTLPATTAPPTTAVTTQPPTTNAPTTLPPVGTEPPVTLPVVTTAPPTVAPTTTPPTAAPTTTTPPTTAAPVTTQPPTPAPPSGGMNMQLPGIDPSQGTGRASNEILRRQDGSTGSFNGLGEVRIICGVSHHDYVDPIVLPGNDGGSHLHTFIGNAGTDANSTYESLRNEPAGSTCSGGAVNKSSYWFPSLIDGNANAVAEPTLSFVYYKTGYWGQDGRDVQPVPAGLRMVSGSAATTTEQPTWIASWSCTTDFGGGVPGNTLRDSPSIPRCDMGQLLGLKVLFPQCWDGVNLDSPDHKSHMSHPNFQGQCPSTHPVLLPEITLNVTWEMGPNGTNGFYLASDMMTPDDAPPGLGLHADFFDAWEPQFQETLVTQCLNQRKDCGVWSLGDGYSLIDP